MLTPPSVGRLCIVGAGDVVAKRILPAALELNLASSIMVVHNGICELTGNADDRVAVVQVANLGQLEERFRAYDAPVLVATPPGPRLAIAARARAASLPVILEKPLVTTRAELGQARRLGSDPKLFALSYYVQEKALGWTWLCTRDASLAAWLAGDADRLDRAAAIADDLGPLRSLRIRINEGPERSGHADRAPWYSQVAHGIWLDMGVHVVSMAMLAALRETGETALNIASAGASGRADQLAIAGSAAHFGFEGDFGKNFASAEQARWLEACFSEGVFRCDFDTGTCTMAHRDGRRETLAPLHGAARYRTMLAQACTFLGTGGWGAYRGDLIDLQCDALERIFDCVGG